MNTRETPDDDARFADPLIQEITETWRQRQHMASASMRLTLQAKAICRRFCHGSKTEAGKLYRAVERDEAHPLADAVRLAIAPLMLAREPLDAQRKHYEKHLRKLAARLPIASAADEILGVGPITVAKIVGECGDLGAYRKGVAGIWKRAGLAVIDGARQQKRLGTQNAERQGYSPARHAVFWNIGASLLKAQGTGEAAGPYRRVYDTRRRYEEANGATPLHAHRRAQRYMTKRLLKHLWVRWVRSQTPHSAPEAP